MKIVWDLDGVLRDLTGYLSMFAGVPPPAQWEWNVNGKGIYQLVEEDSYRPLYESIPTKYLRLAIRASKKVVVWTSQPVRWRKYTEQWLERNLPNKFEVHYLTTDNKRNWLDSETDTVLVEDNPNFSSYNRIVLVDYDYNRHLNVDRVFNEKQLLEYLKIMNGRLG